MESILKSETTASAWTARLNRNCSHPFFSTKGHQGTGLGLFIAGVVIEQHGGEIQVNSKLQQGTIFRIKIPKLQSESVAGVH
jgi:nitrogen-specific signal transduction histidine kinase